MGSWTPPPTPNPFNTKLESIVFLDVETVPVEESFDKLNEHGKQLFSKKVARKIERDGMHDSFLDQACIQEWIKEASLYCEFNKIVCVSLGVFNTIDDNGNLGIRLKSFYGFDEKAILDELSEKLEKVKVLCAHNGKKFDFPLLARKYMQHGLRIPSILNVTGLKPWEVSHFDTMELWQFNDSQTKVSLDTLCYIFGIKSPKGEMEGSKVAEVFYKAKELKDLFPIVDYCQNKDVYSLMILFLKMIGSSKIVKPENIVIK